MALSKKERNERLEFVRFWVGYMKTHNNEVWSRQQAVLIDSQILGADQDRERYLEVKNAVARMA